MFIYVPFKGAAEVGVEFVQLDDLFAQSDFIVMTCSMTDANRGFINKQSLSKMKSNAILINTSRSLIDLPLQCFYDANLCVQYYFHHL